VRRKKPARGGSLLLTLTVLTVVVVGASAGCSSNPTASDPPQTGSAAATGDPSSSPGAGPSSTPTTLPTKIDTRTLAAHAAVTQVQIMYAEYNLMLATGTADRFTDTFARACTVCTREAQRVLRIRARGQVIVGGICTVSHLRAVEIHSKTVVVRGRLATTEARIMAGKSLINTVSPMEPTTVTWTLSNGSGRWLIYRSPVF
jgi:hypothetical protein